MRRPLAKASPGKGNDPFAALLAAATKEPSAAGDLACAYASLEVGARCRLIDAIVADSLAAGIDCASVLISLLAVEEDTEVARRIAEAMSAAGGDGLAIKGRSRALITGDEHEGALVLVRPLHGSFVEALSLAWSGSEVTQAVFHPLVDDAEMTSDAELRPCREHLEEAPLGFAIDLVTPVLWNHRRTRGALPADIQRFADLFDIPPPPQESNQP